MAAASFNQFDSGMAGEVEMELQTMDHSADLERRGFNPRRLLRRTSSINYRRSHSTLRPTLRRLCNSLYYGPLSL